MDKFYKMSNLIPLLLVVYIIKSFFIEPKIFDIVVVSLMSISFLYKTKLDYEKNIEKEELINSITQIQKEVNDKYLELKRIQDSDRTAADSKFSTLNLSLQRPNKQQEKSNLYGWTR